MRKVKKGAGLDITYPVLCGVKQFHIEGGRYIVFLFKTDRFFGQLISSKDGQMKWVDRKDLKSLPLVDDFEELLRAFNEEALTEFQYILSGERN